MSAPPLPQPTREASPRPTPRGRRRAWLPYAGAVLLVILLIAGLWPQPLVVETALATVGPLRVTVEEEGRTRIRHRFLVSTPVTGQLRRLELKAGALVTQDETVLAIIDPIVPTPLDARSRALAEARRDAAVSQVEKARVTHTFTASELRRMTRLHAEGTVSAQELEAAQWREASAAREMSAAESARQQAEAELAEFGAPGGASSAARSPLALKAPATGRILRMFEENARVVSAGTPLLEVGDPTDLEVVIEVLSRDGARLMPGTPVELDHWGGAQPLRAQVRLVEPAAFTKLSALGVEEQRVNVIADLLTPADQRPTLGDGFRVEAKILLTEVPQALKVPAGALFRRGDQWHAFIINSGRARLRPLEVGPTSGPETQILRGLEPGQRLILYPGDRIREGQRVKSLRVLEQP